MYARNDTFVFSVVQFRSVATEPDAEKEKLAHSNGCKNIQKLRVPAEVREGGHRLYRSFFNNELRRNG